VRVVLAAASVAFSLHPDSAHAATFDRTGPFAERFGEATFDVIVLRPLSATALIAGSAFFVAAAPFVAPFEGVHPAWSTFVYAPYEYTVVRSLGDF
jgi:VIT1/CCC1 family predicted Fe2+/Mn2+ transporter